MDTCAFAGGGEPLVGLSVLLFSDPLLDVDARLSDLSKFRQDRTSRMDCAFR